MTVLAPAVPAGDDGWVTTPHVPRRLLRHGARGPGHRARLAPLVAVAALAVGVAACGGSSSSSTTTTTSGGGTTSTTSPSGGSSTSSSTTSTSTPGTPGCRTSALTVSLGSPNGSAGATHYTLTFRNSGSVTCTLYGYPGVSFLDASGHQIGDPAQRQGSTPATVTLAAGGNAYSSIAVTDPGIPPCSGSATASHVLVYPPGETQSAAVTAPSGLLVCSSPNTSAYQSSSVSPVSTTAI